MSGYQKKYLEQSIYQMSPGELLLLTYDEAIKSLKKAEIFLEEKKYESFENAMKKAARIVRYLDQTLDSEQEISRDLERLYSFLLYDFSRVQSGRERHSAELPKLIGILTDLRDGFSGASKKVKDTHVPKEHRVLV